MALKLDSIQIRDALSTWRDVAATEGDRPPAIQDVYVPSNHSSALSLESSIVIGMRGAGKSFWSSALTDEKLRRYIASKAKLAELEAVAVYRGFGESHGVDFPKSQTLKALLSESIDADAIWRGTVLRHALRELQVPFPFADDVSAAIRWVAANPAIAETRLSECDATLQKNGKRLLVVFDALDRLAADSDWEQVRKLLKPALSFCLECRSRRAIRLKFFLRPDLFDDKNLWSFVDSSKLRHNTVVLSWQSDDLYGLVLQFLANHSDAGPAFRQSLEAEFGWGWPGSPDVYEMSDHIRKDGEKVRSIVEAIAGKYMGSAPKRGHTYSWIPLHLSDAKGQVSPRSFILAFKHAAENTRGGPQSALDHKGIEQGVRQASRVRVHEIREDYPWLEPLLRAASGLTVPCPEEELMQRWSEQVLSEVASNTAKLRPLNFDPNKSEGDRRAALLQALVEIGVIYRTKDKRLNIPDIFRVDAGIKRKGGVKPVGTFAH
jgi:hypothetical protein